MAGLAQLEQQLAFLGDLRGLVKTMKALSAANIRQYEQAVEALAGYAETIDLGLQVVLRDQPPGAQRTGSDPGVAAIVFGSDHGLCGRFNESLAEHVLARLAEVEPDPRQRQVLAVGIRIAATLEQAGQPVDSTVALPGSADRITVAVQHILPRLAAWTDGTEHRPVLLCHQRRTSGQGLQPVTSRLLPLDWQRFARLQREPWPSRSIPCFTLPAETLLRRLLRQFLFVSIFRACAESQASEHASRLAAMQAAQRNLDERSETLTRRFRRARQGLITAELLDVIAGFEAAQSGRDADDQAPR